MAQLTGNPIQNSYLGLIKTNDNAAAGATPKVLTDGAGNTLPMEIGTSSVLFPTGTVDFTGSTVQGLPATTADIPNIANGSMQATITGYPPSTVWTACTFSLGRPSIQLPIPAQSTGMCLVPFNIDSNQTVTTFGIPMEVLANDTLYVAVYEQASNGGPGVRVLNLSKSITTADNNTWVEVTAGSWTPTLGKNYWIGCQTALGAGVGGGLGYISGDSDVFQRFSTTNNSSVGGIVAANTLYYYGSSTPASDLSAASFNYRDERAFYAWQ
jgi:hypothetical protein